MQILLLSKKQDIEQCFDPVQRAAGGRHFVLAAAPRAPGRRTVGSVYCAPDVSGGSSLSETGRAQYHTGAPVSEMGAARAVA